MSNSIIGVRPPPQGQRGAPPALGMVPGSIAPGSLVRPSPYSSGRIPTNSNSNILEIPQPPAAPPPAVPATPHVPLGIPDPASIQSQKDRFARSLEEQLHQGAQLLNQQHKNKIDQLHAQANVSKAHYHLAVDQRVKQEELVLTEKYNDTLMMLQQAAQAKRTELEQQACAMMLEYQQKKTADEFANNESGIKQQYHEAQANLSKQLHKLNANAPRGPSFMATQAMPVANYAPPPGAALYAPPASLFPATPHATLPYMPPAQGSFVPNVYGGSSFVPNVAVRGGGSYVPNAVPTNIMRGGSFVPAVTVRAGGSFVPNVLAPNYTPMPARVFS